MHNNLIKTAVSCPKMVNQALVPGFIRDNIHLFRDYSILDFGCGKHGHHVKQLLDLGLAVWGEDLAFDHEGLERQRRNWWMKYVEIADTHPNVPEFPQGEYPWLGTPATRYDVVYASNVLNVQPSALEVGEVLSTLIGKTTHNLLNEPIGIVLLNVPRDPWYPEDISPELVRHLIRHDGFKRVRRGKTLNPEKDPSAVWCRDPLNRLNLEEV